MIQTGTVSQREGFDNVVSEQICNKAGDHHLS